MIYLKSFYPMPIPTTAQHKFGFEIRYNGVTLERAYQFYGKTEAEVNAWVRNIALQAG